MSSASADDVRDHVRLRATGIVCTGACTTITVPTTPAPSSLSAGDTITVQVQSSFTPLTALIPHAAIPMSATTKMIMAR